MSVGAKQILEEANMVGGHTGLLNKLAFNYDEHGGGILIWVKKATK
jgi:hypothetical protein